jgi:hypothetical protein
VIHVASVEAVKIVEAEAVGPGAGIGFLNLKKDQASDCRNQNLQL